MSKPTLSRVSGLFAIMLVLSACSGSPSLETRDVKIDESYTAGPVDDILVLSLQADELHDSRVIIERSFSQKMKDAGINAIAGYTRFDSMDELLANPSVFEPALEREEVEAVLFIDPVKLDTDYDPGEYAARRSAYRSLGFDDSATINLLSNIAHDASAAKVVMNIGLWIPETDTDVFNSTYDINAPGNYDVENARQYALGFAEIVIEDLRKYGLIQQ